MDLRSWRWRLVTISVSVLLGLALVGFGSFLGGFDHDELDYDEERVVGIPPGGNDHKPIPSYSGAHPSQLTRPEETFPFPIPLGEIGPVQPLFAGPPEYPFLCQTEESKLGQPLVDNQQGWGIRVYALDPEGKKTDEVIGFSKDCSIPTQVSYYYSSKNDGYFRVFSDDAIDDVAQLELNGEQVPFIVRVEMGTINRFIYSIAVLKGARDTEAKADASHWNRRLIYQFRGGVGVGFEQGKNKATSMLKRRKAQLALGYAVVHSSGNQTSNHYNIWMQEDIALRLKQQFVGRYGQPLYTVGVGGSGGAIQQYLLGQNRQGTLDAAIPLMSYPDMVSQTIYALDCDLLEYYFDVTDGRNPKWQSWENRTLIEGVHAKNTDEVRYGYLYRLSRMFMGLWPAPPGGESECTQGWRGPSQLVHNPNFVSTYKRYKHHVRRDVHWSHWENLKQIYGVTDNGYARDTWDNVGVQYGLAALTNGHISTEEFLHVNRKIGGWRKQHVMKKPSFWLLDGDSDLDELSVWSHRNMTLEGEGGVAPRTEADLDAITAAYRAGVVFIGKIDIPIIDVRHYLDPYSDMHHSFASFATRQRMIDFQGHADQQVVWVSDRDYNPTSRAFAVVEEWMANRLGGKSLIDAMPVSARDTCFDGVGAIIASGQGVWDGEWNGKADGRCMQTYPNYHSSRMMAGDSIRGDIFKCALQPVEEALAKGLYGPVDMENHIDELKAIFPQGVCDYSKPGLGYPADYINELKIASALNSTSRHIAANASR